MQIIISPAKKINDKNDFIVNDLQQPKFFKEALKLYTYLQSLDKTKLKHLYKASDKLVDEAYANLHHYDINHGFLTAINAYDGIQYQYMHASLFNNQEIEFLNHHLYIISGLYGLLRPLDKIIPYRLEMQSRINCQGYHNLYDYWNCQLADVLNANNEIVLNLASVEYSKAIKKYIPGNQWIDVFFYEVTPDGLKEKGVYAKMARGTMIRYIAENKINCPSDLIAFSDLNYQFNQELSNDYTYVFVRRI